MGGALRDIHVLVVDDSAVVRERARQVLGAQAGLVVEVAADPLIAQAKMRRQRPDVLVLDLELPRMDGLTFLRQLMAEEPLPVVVCSHFAERGSDLALRALEEGAVEIVSKSRLGTRDAADGSVLLVDAIRAAAQATVRRRPAAAPLRAPPLAGSPHAGPPHAGPPHAGLPPPAAPGLPPAGAARTGATAALPPRPSAPPLSLPHLSGLPVPPGSPLGAALPPRAPLPAGAPVAPLPLGGGLPMAFPAGRLLVLGASTGGTEALRVVLEAMPANAPPIAIVQHMPEGFTAAFARRLDSSCRVRVREAAGGEELVPGVVLVAPGNRHLSVVREGGRLVARVDDGPLVSRHRPSVDVLFRSAAQAVGRGVVAALLTGMGADGAEGLLELRQAGAMTLAQSEATCVVFGMPKEAIARGAAVEVVGLPHVAGALLRHAALPLSARRTAG
jgi:two-component system chemotaxis response regulator CheB